MARKPTRTRSTGSVAEVRERLAVLEADLGNAIAALPRDVELQVTKALKPVFDALDRLATQSAMDAVILRVQQLETARSYAAGAVKVEQRVHTELQEWARTLFPYAFMLISALVSWRIWGH